MVRHNNQLPDNLPQLQNLIKRDSESYKEEFFQQHQHYRSTLEVFRLEPAQFNKSLDELVTFLAQPYLSLPSYGDEKQVLREKVRANRISIFTKIVIMEEYLESTKDIILCRESIITRLYSLIGQENEPLPESIFVYGHMATGKSFIVRNLLEYLRYNVSYINCMEYLGNRHMYNYILDDLIAQSTEKSCNNALLKRNCDNILDFILALKTISLNDKRPIVLVFDMCHKIRDIDVTFLPAILRLRELSGINVCTILISNIAWEKFRATIGTLEPIKIHFTQYTKDELVQLLLLYRPAMHYDIYFYKNYLNLFLSVFFRFCRDLNELRYMAELNFAKYIEPIENKRIERDNIAALWRNISVILKSNLEVIYLRVSMGHFSQPRNDRVSCEIESTTKLALSFELPFYAKYILIAAYLASCNPAKNDKRIFAKRDNKKKIRSNKKLVKQVDCVKKPRIFTISRMLAIFCSIIDEKIDINANLLAQVSTMCQLGLLVAAGGDNILQLDEPKFKCCVSHDFVTVIAKTVGFHIMNYLSIAHCYPNELKSYPQEIVDILRTHNTILNNQMRMTFCKALIQLRNKSLLEPTALLSLFFELLKCQDKILRQFLQTHIITDIKNVNAKCKNAKINTVLQNFMFTMLKNSNGKAAKMSLDIMIELYNKNVWNDAKTVNVIATLGCFSKVTKIMVASMKFFLGTDTENKEADDNDSSESDDEPDIKEVMMANKVNKKTKKREKQLKKAKQLLKKTKKKKSKAPQYNFSALHLIHDPQDFAEKLFIQMQKNNDRFEVKLITLDVISRLIGLHNLFLLNFYPYIQRFLHPHQRDVTRLLQFIAQASHELIPPDVLEPVLKTLVNNFITERNSADVMAIGLNTVREICTRCTLAMNADLLQDLVQYKNYKERSVMIAARSLIGTFRCIMPSLLHKKERGRPTEANIIVQSSKYGEIRPCEFVPGAEILHNEYTETVEETSSEDEDSEWIDISDSGEEEISDTELIRDEKIKDFSVSGEENNDKHSTLYCNKIDDIDNDNKINIEALEMNKSSREKDSVTKQLKIQKLKTKCELQPNEDVIAEKMTKASVISVERILTDEDFKKIDVGLVKRQLTYAKRGLKRTHAENETNKRGELIKLSDIENIYKKRKYDKKARLESVKKGQEGREKFGYKDGRHDPLCSKTNREKKKKKVFGMIKHKLKGKVKRSFKDKQIALRNHLLKQRRMK